MLVDDNEDSFDSNAEGNMELFLFGSISYFLHLGSRHDKDAAVYRSINIF